MQLINITRELVLSLPKEEREKVLDKRNIWLSKQRAQDKLEQTRIHKKIEHLKQRFYKHLTHWCVAVNGYMLHYRVEGLKTGEVKEYFHIYSRNG